MNRLPSGMKPSAYEATNNEGLLDLRLKSEDIEKIHKNDLRLHAQELKQKFPGLDKYPPSAQKALLDLHYNVGVTKFRPEYINPKTGKNEGWPKLYEAIRRNDWDTAAKESHRPDVSKERNNRIEELLRQAKEEH